MSVVYLHGAFCVVQLFFTVMLTPFTDNKSCGTDVLFRGLSVLDYSVCMVSSGTTLISEGFECLS